MRVERRRRAPRRARPRPTSPARVHEREPDVGRRDAALRVQHALEHRRVRLDEQRLHHRQQRLGVARGRRRPCPRARTRSSRRTARCRRAPTRRSRPAPPMSTSGKRNGSSPPSTAKSSGAPASSSSVSRSRPAAACLMPDDVRVLRGLEHAGGAQVAAGAERDVVEHERHRAARRRPPGSGRRSRPPTAARNTARR